MSDDPRRLIVRLAVAVMAADGRITLDELAAVEGLDRLGLGNLSGLVREEIERATREPIDVSAACAGLSAVSPQAGAVILAALAEIAACDSDLSPREVQVLERVGALLGIPPRLTRHVLGARTMSAPGAAAPETAAPPSPAPHAAEVAHPGAAPPSRDPALAHAYMLLDVDPPVTRPQLDAVYRALVARYDPAKVLDLGPEFAVLAVRKLADITTAYELVVASEARG